MKRSSVFNWCVSAMFLTGFSSVFAQKISSGNVAFLEGETAIRVVFDNSKLVYGDLKRSEEAYVSARAKVVARNEAKEDFRKTWERHVNRNIPRKFLTSANKNSDLQFVTDSLTNYTLIVKSLWMIPGEPGWKKARLNATLTFVDTQNLEREYLKIDFKRIKGGSMGKTRNLYMEECYAKTAKEMARLLKKQQRKKRGSL
ncbi:hypothetical protein [Flavobacterium sp. JP2137]|uniref:hypothetical protein n=1 Tax=Flavobacterium sp. JP2137 TaxID=3414510 RepID=UPI003D2FDDAC